MASHGPPGLDDNIDIADLTVLVAFSFKGGSEPPSTIESNVNGSEDDAIDIRDITYLVEYMFKNGAAPPACPVE